MADTPDNPQNTKDDGLSPSTSRQLRARKHTTLPITKGKTSGHKTGNVDADAGAGRDNDRRAQQAEGGGGGYAEERENTDEARGSESGKTAANDRGG